MKHVLRNGTVVRTGGLLLLFFFLLAAVPALADIYDNIDPDVNGDIEAVAVQEDGKILIGGNFTGVNGVGRSRIARINADGSLDLTFNPGSGANGEVSAIAVQGDRIIIGGYFTSINGVARNYIARLNGDGSVDTTFNPGSGANDPVYAIAAPGSNVTIVGRFTTFNGISRNSIVRLNYSGSVDTTFDPGSGANAGIHTLALHADGTILIAGPFTTYNGISRNRVARLFGDGRLDTSFGSSGGGLNGYVQVLAEQADGSIVVGGVFTAFNSTSRNHIARLKRDGSLDTTFDPGSGAVLAVVTLVIQPDGRILIGGMFTSFDGYSINRIGRLDYNGALDLTFRARIGSGANNIVSALAVLPDSRILIGGSFTAVDGKSRNHFAHILPSGFLDESFDPGSGFSVGSVSVITNQPDGRIFVGGDFTSYKGVSRGRIVRLWNNGTLDTNFGLGSSGANDTVEALAVQADGRVLIGGWFTSFNGTSRNRIARLNSINGSLDTTFDPGSGANAAVSTLAIQSDGRILIGGLFTSVEGVARNRIARLNANGTLDTSFDPGSGANAAISTLAIQPDGRILIGGLFTSVDGVARNRIARLNANGSLDLTFNPGSGANGNVSSIAVKTSKFSVKILVAGAFSGFNGISRNRIALLKVDGSLDLTFNPGLGANASIDAMELLANGKVFIGGVFTTFNGVSRNHLARLKYDGSLDMTFTPGTGTNNDVNALAVQPDGRVLLGGRFTSINGLVRNRIARISQQGAALQSLSLGVDTDGIWITWRRSGTVPAFNRTTLDLSIDGIHWVPLVGSGWRLTGKWYFGPLRLPFNSIRYVRARGYSSSGSGLQAESVAQFFLTGKNHTFYIIRSPSGSTAVIAM